MGADEFLDRSLEIAKLFSKDWKIEAEKILSNL